MRSQDLLQLRRNLGPWFGRIATTAPWHYYAAALLGLVLALRPLVAASWLLSLRLTYRFGEPRRRPSVPFAVDGRGIRASDTSTSAPALALTLAATAAALLGQQVLGNLGLGKVVLVGGQGSEPFRPAGHPDLRIPHGPELVGPRRRRRESDFCFRFLGIARFSHLEVALLMAVAATAATAATPPASAGRRLAALGDFAFGNLSSLGDLDGLLGGFLQQLLIDRLAAFGSGPRSGESLARQSNQAATGSA
ncbi:MAG TPA: hypothetical protein VF349_00245 [Candidatus Limnocylindrales bacterium]